MFRISALLFSGLALAAAGAHAAPHELSGTWKYAKTAEFGGEVRSTPAPEYPVLQIINGAMFLQPRCEFKITYTKKSYSYNELFQAALQSGTDEGAMDKFVQKQFGAPLSSAKVYFEGGTVKPKCLYEHRNMFLLNDKLVVANGYGSFDGYERVPAPAATSAVNVYGRKFSQLPYRNDVFHELCAGLIPSKKGTPQATDACAPVLYPYSASKADTDPLAKLIGSHSYTKFGKDIGKDYDNPVAHGLHPVFMVFPAMKDVLVVAVEDIEQGEGADRTGMGGVYLSIKGDKVVDQISAGCDLRPDYSCVDTNGKKVYQLSDSGKFQKAGK